VFFKNGQEIKRIVGAQGKAQLQKIIDEILG
jgi:thioredoxin-like negative regulator of GroEL